MERVNFKQMKDGTKEEYDFLTGHETEYAADTADRLLKALVELDESLSGYQVTRLGHSLQSATMMNMLPPFFDPSCANNARGRWRSMAIFR